MDNAPNLNSPELPRPQQDGSYENIPSGSIDSNPEKLSPTSELISQAKGAVAQAVQPMAQPQAPAVPVIPIQQQTTDDNSANPTIAEDNDVLEKEWVDKAKKIVAETKNDPREQTNKFAVMRYDYVKKRYGKEMVVSNDSPKE